MKKYIFATLLAIALCMTPSSALADVIPQSDTVNGIVVDKDNQPLPGAKVEIVGQPFSAFTDLDGRFSIKCDPGAKNILVSYPKAPDVKTKIKPDMRIRIGRTWRDAPDHYQWFVGANCGAGITSLFINDIPGHNTTYDVHETTEHATLSLMGGRVKDVGWYIKAFATPKAWCYGYYDYNGGAEDVYSSTSGLILGGMVRMNCPLHFCLGFGVASTRFENIPSNKYNRINWQIDFGFLYRIGNHFGVNLSFNAGVNNYFNYVAGSYGNLGVSYFFNK